MCEVGSAAGVVRQAVPGDGACLFHSFKCAHARVSDRPTNPRALRAEVVTHLTRHRDRYEVLWNGFVPDGSKCKDFNTYLSLIASEDAYASDLEVAALERLYDVKIVVIPHTLQFPAVALHIKKQKRIVGLWWDLGWCSFRSAIAPHGWQTSICYAWWR